MRIKSPPLASVTGEVDQLSVLSRGGASKLWRPLLLVIPAFLVLTLVFVIPLIEVFYRSISDPVIGLQNYGWLITTPINLLIALRTFGTALGVTVICLAVSYPYAYLMTIVRDRTRVLMTIFVMMPLWTSILVRTLAWLVLLQDSGPINDLLESVGFGRVALIRTTFGVALAMTQVLMPFMVLPLYSTMAKISPALLPAARSLGASPVTSFFTVYLPLSRPGIMGGSVTVFILGLGFYIIPALLGSPKQVMMSALIQQQISGFLLWGQGTALGVALLAATLLALAVGVKLSRGTSIMPSLEQK